MSKQAVSLRDASARREVTNGDVKPKDLAAMLQSPKMAAQIKAALPRHMTPERMARVALTELRKTPKLMQCEPASFLGAVVQCAQLGLEPGGVLGHCYLLPFDNRAKKTTDVQLIVGYKGMLDLARRSGQIVSISARAVHRGDEFSCRYGLDEALHHVPADGDQGEITHVYAVARLKDGGTQFEVLTRRQIDAIRDSSQGYQSAKRFGGKHPWAEHYEEMARKTAIRRLFKYLPVSIELQTAVAIDERADAGVSCDFGSVLDAEPDQIREVDPPPSNDADDVADAEISYAYVLDRMQRATSPDALGMAAADIELIKDAGQRAELVAKRDELLAKLGA